MLDIYVNHIRFISLSVLCYVPCRLRISRQLVGVTPEALVPPGQELLQHLDAAALWRHKKRAASVFLTAPAIENVHNFFDFRRALVLWSLRIGYFFKLADNGLSSCMSGEPSTHENGAIWGNALGEAREL